MVRVQFQSGTLNFLLNNNNYVIPIKGQVIGGGYSAVCSPSLRYLQNKKSITNCVIAELALRTKWLYLCGCNVSVWVNACDPHERACCARSRRFVLWWPWELSLIKFFITTVQKANSNHTTGDCKPRANCKLHYCDIRYCPKGKWQPHCCINYYYFNSDIQCLLSLVFYICMHIALSCRH